VFSCRDNRRRKDSQSEGEIKWGTAGANEGQKKGLLQAAKRRRRRNERSRGKGGRWTEAGKVLRGTAVEEPPSLNLASPHVACVKVCFGRRPILIGWPLRRLSAVGNRGPTSDNSREV
jgi:hypothetical protein